MLLIWCRRAGYTSQPLSDIGPDRQPVSSRRVYESVPTARLKHGIEYQHFHPLVSQVAAPQDCLITVIGSLETELRVEEVDFLRIEHRYATSSG